MASIETAAQSAPSAPTPEEIRLERMAKAVEIRATSNKVEQNHLKKVVLTEEILFLYRILRHGLPRDWKNEQECYRAYTGGVTALASVCYNTDPKLDRRFWRFYRKVSRRHFRRNGSAT